MIEVADRNFKVRVGQEVAKVASHIQSSAFEIEALGEEGASLTKNGILKSLEQKPGRLEVELRLKTKASKTDTAMALR